MPPPPVAFRSRPSPSSSSKSSRSSRASAALRLDTAEPGVARECTGCSGLFLSSPSSCVASRDDPRLRSEGRGRPPSPVGPAPWSPALALALPWITMSSTARTCTGPSALGERRPPRRVPAPLRLGRDRTAADEDRTAEALWGRRGRRRGPRRRRARAPCSSPAALRSSPCAAAVTGAAAPSGLWSRLFRGAARVAQVTVRRPPQGRPNMATARESRMKRRGRPSAHRSTLSPSRSSLVTTCGAPPRLWRWLRRLRAASCEVLLPPRRDPDCGRNSPRVPCPSDGGGGGDLPSW